MRENEFYMCEGGSVTLHWILRPKGLIELKHWIMPRSLSSSAPVWFCGRSCRRITRYVATMPRHLMYVLVHKLVEKRWLCEADRERSAHVTSGRSSASQVRRWRSRWANGDVGWKDRSNHNQQGEENTSLYNQVCE